MRIVVVGGYGNFGARICRALAAHPGIEVVATGRSARQSDPGSRIGSATLDLAAPDFASALSALSPNVVIHCAGPFQGQDYRVAEAAIDVGAHYIDLADSREFVARFAKSVDPIARKAGLLAISGASTLPALSSAVVDHFAKRLARLDEIHIAIAPGQRAPRGAATIAGVFSYAGKPFKWLSGGAWTTATGWQELQRIRFAGLGERLGAACDVPDLELFPERYPGVQTVEFRAALELKIQTLAIWLAAGLRRMGVPLPIERWAVPIDRLASMLNVFGGERGGMLVALAGTRIDGSAARIEWHVTADGNHGPEIPCMAATLLALKLACGELKGAGAFPCMGFLTLADFEPELARWRMSTAIEEKDA